MHKILGLLLGAVVNTDQQSKLLDHLRSISVEDETQLVAELARVSLLTLELYLTDLL